MDSGGRTTPVKNTGSTFGNAEMAELIQKHQGPLITIGTLSSKMSTADTRPVQLNSQAGSPKTFPVPTRRARTRLYVQESSALKIPPQHSTYRVLAATQSTKRHKPGDIVAGPPTVAFKFCDLFPPCPVRAQLKDRCDAFATEKIKEAEAARANMDVRPCVYCLCFIQCTDNGMTVHHGVCPKAPWNMGPLVLPY
jgi:hypothetical protein